MVVTDIDVERGETVPATLLSELFETGPLVRGMNVRFDPDGDRFVVLFGRRASGALGSELGFEDEDETRFRYIGEGQRGDQSLNGANGVLRESIDHDVPIFFFLVEDDGGFTYYGKAQVTDYSWEPFPDVDGNERRAVVFDLELERAPSSASLSSLLIISGSAL